MSALLGGRLEVEGPVEVSGMGIEETGRVTLLRLPAPTEERRVCFTHDMLPQVRSGHRRIRRGIEILERQQVGLLLLLPIEAEYRPDQGQLKEAGVGVRQAPQHACP